MNKQNLLVPMPGADIEEVTSCGSGGIDTREPSEASTTSSDVANADSAV